MKHQHKKNKRMHYKLVKNKLTKEIITLHALFTNKELKKRGFNISIVTKENFRTNHLSLKLKNARILSSRLKVV